MEGENDYTAEKSSHNRTVIGFIQKLKYISDFCYSAYQE